MKVLSGAGVAYLWKRIKALVEPFATRSQLNAVLSGLQTELNTKADIESGTCALKLEAQDGTELGTASGTYKKIDGLVYVQAEFHTDTAPSSDIVSITGFPFTVPVSGGATNASDLHYTTSANLELPKTFSVPTDGYVACEAMKPQALFIYGTYIP